VSVHDRPKYRPHIHFQSEVVEARQVRPKRPPYRGVHWSDTVIDGTLTLDKTVVDFTRQWEAEDCAIHPNAHIGSDSVCSGGKNVVCEITDPYMIALVTGSSVGLGVGTGHALEAGDLVLAISLATHDNSTSNNLFRIGIYNCATGSPLGYRTIKCNEFTQSYKYQMFSVKIHVNENQTDLAIYIEWLGNNVTNGFIDWIGITPINVPLADTGITNPNTGTGITVPAAPAQTVGVQQNGSGSQSCTLDTWTQVGNWTVSNTDHDVLMVFGQLKSPTGASDSYRIYVRIKDATNSLYYPDSNGLYLMMTGYGEVGRYRHTNFFISIPKNVKNHDLRIEVNPAYTVTVDVVWNNWGHSPHTHIPDDPQHTHIPNDPEHEH